MDLQVSKQDKHFSNSILRAYLKYVDRYHISDLIQALEAGLGVSREWLQDPNQWHSATFHDKFLKILKERIPHPEELSVNVARDAFKQKGMQIFSAMVGMLIKPEVLWRMLPKTSERMNLYNTYEFISPGNLLTFPKAALIQRYLDPSLADLNAELCDAARGSTIGILEATGNRILDFKEVSCIKKGDPCCRYEHLERHFTINKNSLLR